MSTGNSGSNGSGVLGGAVAGERGRLTGAAVLASAHQGGEALIPVIVGIVIDQAVSTGSVSALLRWIAVLAVVFAVLSFSYRFAARASEKASQQAAHRLRLALSARVLDPRGGAESGRLPGALVNITTGDTRRVGAVIGMLPFAIAGFVGLLVSAIALLRISIPLGLLVLLGTPPLLWLTHLVGRPLERRSGLEQERAAHASGIAADLVTGLRVLKGIGAERAAVTRYKRTSRDSLAATLSAARAHAGHDGVILALTGIFIAVVALVGANLAANDAITVGQLVAAVGLAQFLLGPFQILAWANGQFAQGRASAARVSSVLTAPPAVTGGARQPSTPVAGEVKLRGVSHGSLRAVDIDIRAGELVGIVTTDPACATELLECLGREADPASGALELDGTGFTALDPTLLRGSVLVAAHDADLFEGSLLDNVVAASTVKSPEKALVAAAADEVAATLPAGVHTAVAERGRSLSGGQRQRVALARALAADPPVLVVHDPTTAVDAVTEARIAAELKEIRAGRTTVLVTTSPALLAITDRVVVLGDGTVRAEGAHADLAASDPGYRTAVLS